ncbi:MAG: radical SAM protein [Deltaproteobacteria bacterium]|nr:radical SAM protein [Deltaproteobacteria bacterium]
MTQLGYIQVTRICNQRCLFCSNPDNQRLVTLEGFRAQLRDLVETGHPGVLLTGGEPTLHPELPRLVELAARAGLAVRIITNGQETSRPGVLARLRRAGLRHLHVSLYSSRPAVQERITRHPGSRRRIARTLREAERLRLTVDVNVVLSALNAPHLPETVRWVVRSFPRVRHFVFNGLDPHTDRVAEHPEVVPKLSDLELPLLRTLAFLEAEERTFRVERIPLCYLGDWPHVSTETRKIVKGEGRVIHFLDAKGRHAATSFEHEKAACCAACTLAPICAGLYSMDRYYASSELYPLFVDPEPIRRRILEDGEGSPG